MLHHVETFEADDTIESDFESAESGIETRYHVRNVTEFSDSGIPEDSQGPENADIGSATPLQPVNEQVNLVDNNLVDNIVEEGVDNSISAVPERTTRSGRPVRAPNKLDL